MAKKIQVVVDVESDSVKFATDQTLTLTQQVRLLYKELQKVPEGTKEWTTLQKAYNDTKDNLDKVSIKSKELFGTLSTLPGPVGDFSAKLQGGIDLLKVFSSFTLKDLGNSFKGVVSDIGDVFNNLTGATKAVQETGKVTEQSSEQVDLYANSMSNAASAAVTTQKVEKEGAETRKELIKQTEKYGLYINGQYVPSTRAAAQATQTLAAAEETAAVATNTLSASIKGLLAATGIGLLIALLTSVVFKLIDFFDATKKSEAAVKSFNEALKEQERLLQNDVTALDQASKAAELRAKLAGKTEKEVFEIAKKFGQEKLDLLRNFDQQLYKDRELIDKNTKMTEADKAKAVADINAKILKNGQDINKQIAENDIAQLQFKVKQYEEAKKAGDEAAKKQLEDAKKALEERKTQYKEDYAAYAGALKERKDATDNFYAKEKFELAKQKFENGMSEAEYNDKILAITVEKNQQLAADEKVILEGRLAFLKDGLSKKLITQKEYDQLLIDAQRDYNASISGLEQEGYNTSTKLIEEAGKKQQEYKDKLVSVNNEIKQSWYDLGSTIASSISSLINIFEQGSDLQKAFGIVSVLVNAAAAIGKIQLSAQEATADFSKTIATGTATIASGTALLTNPITAAVGAAQVAAGKAAVATGTAGIAAVKSNSVRQTIGVGITSAAQVAAILAAKKSSSSASAGGGAAQNTTPAFNGTVNVPAPVIGASQASQSGNLATTIAGAVAEGNSKSRPIQTYVVGDQISTQQQLDRRISVAAKMAG